MAITVSCECGWTTDLERTSETNPAHCPKCGGTIMIDGTDEPFWVENYITANGEDRVEYDRRHETWTTYTRGTREPLYHGGDEQAARESLEMNEDDWARLLADED